MKLAFLDGERKDIPLGKGHYSIGSDPGDDVNLGDAIGDARATLILDQRGVTLNVDGGVGAVVNSRAVKEKAILRIGDVITLGDVAMILRSDNIDVNTPPQPFDAVTEREMPSRFHLRGINGSCAGQAFPIRGQLTLGSKPAHEVKLSSDVNISLTIGSSNGRLYLKRDGGDGELIVNGIEVQHASLNPGDQILIGNDRFLLEAPGFVPGQAYGGEAEQAAATSNTQVFQAITDADRREPDTPKPASRDSSRPSMDPATRRDAMIIGFCVLLSAAMLAWLYSNL